MLQTKKLSINKILLLALITFCTINKLSAQNEDIPYHVYPGSGCSVSQTSTTSQTGSGGSSGGGSGPGGTVIYPRPFLPVKTILYDIRDKCLDNSTKGKRYISEYYFVSDINKDWSKFTVQAMNDVIDIMPSIYASSKNYLDAKYDGIIVENTFSLKLISVLNSYKALSKDSKYNSIIDNLILDVKTVSNMTKSQVVQFMTSK